MLVKVFQIDKKFFLMIMKVSQFPGSSTKIAQSPNLSWPLSQEIKVVFSTDQQKSEKCV